MERQRNKEQNRDRKLLRQFRTIRKLKGNSSLEAMTDWMLDVEDYLSYQDRLIQSQYKK